ISVNFVFSGEGITTDDTFIRMSVAPNPTTTACIFSLPDTGIAGNLKIYDISGRTVYEKNIPAGVTTHLFGAGSTLPAGVYQVRYISGGRSASTRMVVAN
ncbi:MAG: T9SS type A sorting domain-containing protein, partial [Candidatus Fermentibacteria bacterium]|nr:T9SS type A sorting domain-containing protein [Candidatus Fermentibacteria bacterium]